MRRGGEGTGTVPGLEQGGQSPEISALELCPIWPGIADSF